MDGKEYHFCFAYQGDRMRTFVFKDLRLQQAEGISADDGTQLVRISLCRRNGRREANIPRIIDEYNRRSGSQPIVPIVVDGNSKAIVCFKANQPVESNPILYRIDWEKSSKRYWRWDAPDPKTKPKHQTVLAGLEGLVRELNLNPNNLCMNSAYDVISKAYYEIKGVELKQLGSFPAEDKDFLLLELKRHFDRERMFVVAPPTKEALSARTKAITNPGDLMKDLLFTDEPNSSGPPPLVNDTVRRYFAKMLPLWADQSEVTVTFKDVLAVFNAQSAGIYRHQSVVSFMRPLMSAGLVHMCGDHLLSIKAGQIADFLKK